MTLLTLDHLLIAVRDLDAGAADYDRLLGRAPSWRGRHPQYGTANVLYRLGNGYLELLVPDPDGEHSPWRDALEGALDRTGEGIYAIALGTDDIDATVACARERDLTVANPAPGDGVDLITGAARRWRNARIDPAGTRGINAFFIQHDSPPGSLPPARSTAGGGGHATAFDHIVVASSGLAATLRLWQETFGLDHRLALDTPNGRRLHFLRMGTATPQDGEGAILELAGEAEPERPGDRDVLWGVAYRVDSVARAVERLRRAGVEVSDARPGNAPGTVVADIKPGFSRDVRTLLIEKEARV